MSTENPLSEESTERLVSTVKNHRSAKASPNGTHNEWVLFAAEQELSRRENVPLSLTEGGA